MRFACLFGWHKPDLKNIFNESSPVLIHKEPTSNCGIQLAKSVCAHCGKEINVKRTGWFGVPTELSEWTLASREDLERVDFLKQMKK